MKCLNLNTLAILVLMSACGNHTPEKNNADSAINSPSRIDSISTPLPKVEVSSPFIIDKSIVKENFISLLPEFSDGRKLNRDYVTADGKGYKIVIGDINADGLEDAVVDYSLEKTVKDDEEFGRASYDVSGVMAFINTGKGIQLIDKTSGFSRSREHSELKSIKSGVIIFESKEYAENDPMCCPSQTVRIKVILKNGKLIELDGLGN